MQAAFNGINRKVQLKPLRWRTVAPPPAVPEDEELLDSAPPIAQLKLSSNFENAATAATAAAGQGSGALVPEEGMSVLKSASSYRSVFPP